MAKPSTYNVTRNFDGFIGMEYKTHFGTRWVQCELAVV